MAVSELYYGSYELSEYEDTRLVKKLAAISDVVIENFKPGSEC